MIIVHISPNATFNDDYGYQENLLPKYQSKLGHKVFLITTDLIQKDGKISKYDGPMQYQLNGFTVVRISKKIYHPSFLTKLYSFLPIYDILESVKPDLIFFHCLVSKTIFEAIKYKRNHPECKIVQDNHLDYEIGTSQKGINKMILKEYYRHLNRKSIKYVEKVYGVTPWRSQYAIDFFGIPSKKVDLLLMGADDEVLTSINKEKVKQNIRNKYGISKEEFLIVTGGKMDSKKSIISLLKACSKLEKVRLLIFGSFSSVEMELANKYIDQKKIIFIGWIESKKAYEYFISADLIAFPGRHSVLWEQACASKTPCIFSRWPGMDHINNDGTASFFCSLDADSIEVDLRNLLFTNKYFEMVQKCNSHLTDIYLYSNIAKKSIEVINR
ncbi:MAG: glycosyltransferase [Bacilli bacterium]|nr:glycosyltransferase [Bacilli bacterium]